MILAIIARAVQPPMLLLAHSWLERKKPAARRTGAAADARR